MRANPQPFYYRRLASPLHATRAGVAAAWALALTAAALALFQPLVLLALTFAVLAAGAAAGVGPALARALRAAVIVAIPIVAINVLVSRQGLTVFARLGDLGPFGQGDLTVEALVYGAVIALKVTLLMLVSALASLAIDPDELLRAFRRLSFRSALTASVSTRMIPLLAADAGRLAEAQRTRPGGGADSARARLALVAAVVGGSLDRAMDVAATLELRGFGAPDGARRRGPSGGGTGATGQPGRGAGPPLAAGPDRRPHRWPDVRAGLGPLRRTLRGCSRHDLGFACSAIAVVALTVLARLGQLAPFEAYPRIAAPITAGTLALCVALLVAILLPFVDRRGIEP
ncbi:MAG TPA: energy-coupling factor transporter transmembrane component T [Solirubrobacteraceae bacterium]|nr:energy-coupling factor transporter transmembrane component T [Solirubrobacteraceae bacterium]